jgi:hypothetical protein
MIDAQAKGIAADSIDYDYAVNKNESPVLSTRRD